MRPQDGTDFVGEPYRVLGAAENVFVADDVERVQYLWDRAALLHHAVDLVGDEGLRWIAQDAEDRANRSAGL